MDERIKQQYHKIYSEMYIIILCLAAASVVIKTAFFHGTMVTLSLEYIILVGSPLYRLIRCRMLGAVAEPAADNTRMFLIRLTAALLLTAAIFGMVMYFRYGSINIRNYILFVIPYLLIFLLAALFFKKLRDKWRKHLENKYDES